MPNSDLHEGNYLTHSSSTIFLGEVVIAVVNTVPGYHGL